MSNKYSVKNGLVYLFTIVFLSTTLVACNSNSGKEKVSEETDAKEIAEEGGEECTTELASIIEWNNKRKKEEDVISIFEMTGNKFSFVRPPNDNNRIHVYLAFNEDSNKLKLAIVPVKTDSGKTPIIYECSKAEISAEKLDLVLPLGSSQYEHNADSISFEEASFRVNNWINDSIRNLWIHSMFVEEHSTKIFQAFVIKAMDIKVGVTHNAYFALRQDTANPEVFYPDLIIVNDTTVLNFHGIEGIVTRKQISNVEDLVRSVPPFGLYPETDFSNFTILSENNIE